MSDGATASTNGDVPQRVVRVRSATPEDSRTIHAIIDAVAATGAVLPRSIEDIDLWIESFVVGMVDGQVLGCAALMTVGGPRIAEIRSVAVLDSARGTGLGRQIVEYLVEEAHSLGLERVFLLTRVPAFFEKCGFRTIQPEELPDSFLADLVHAQKRSLFNKFVMAREIALLSGFADSATVDGAAWRKVRAAKAKRAAATRTVEPVPARKRVGERVA